MALTTAKKKTSPSREESGIVWSDSSLESSSDSDEEEVIPARMVIK